ncbi:MAG: hypothetical protein M3Q07_13345 [Pseudobdellovibrionaceae bacterium]|nr:hypothetical protein [Pseudobdellovibrionaceae bacterium]
MKKLLSTDLFFQITSCGVRAPRARSAPGSIAARRTAVRIRYKNRHLVINTLVLNWFKTKARSIRAHMVENVTTPVARHEL